MEQAKKKKPSPQKKKAETYYHNQQENYGFTSGKYAPKYSPAKFTTDHSGAANVPMSYAGPPSVQEINRNQNRKRGDRPPVAPQGMQKGGGVAISFTPPGQKKKKQQKKKAETTNFEQRAQSLESQRLAQQKRKNYRPQTATQNASYNKPVRGTNTRMQILAHKRAHQQKLERGEVNQGKTVEIYHKKKEKRQQEGASLRQRMSPARHIPEEPLTQTNWPSSIDGLNTSSNARSTQQHFYQQQRQDL